MPHIHRLPQHLINKLKAWEIVERPASVVKELIENALDAWATSLTIDIQQWGKKLIRVVDNWTGMWQQDLELSIARHATSKIIQEHDLLSIESYGFRGEALATISEVSLFRIQSKEESTDYAYELYRDDTRFSSQPIAFERSHGTTVIVQDLFHSIPVRKKYLKSDTTERSYIKTIFLQYVLVHRQKHRSLTNNTKPRKIFAPAKSLLQRILDVTTPDREPHLHVVDTQDDQLHIFGVVWDAGLHFGKQQYLWVFVNWRPVQDRVLKKAVLQAYYKQLAPRTYPFVCLFIEIDPELVDVNVHPRKTEVKFLDPWSIFTRVLHTIQWALGDKKVTYAAFTKPAIQSVKSLSNRPSWWVARQPKTYKNHDRSRSHMISDAQLQLLKDAWHHRQTLSVQEPSGRYRSSQTDHLSESGGIQMLWESYTLLWQLWKTYIMLQGSDHLLLIDQHALAERITFEKMRHQIRDEWFVTDLLLTPLKILYPQDIDIATKLEQMSAIWYDIQQLWEQSLVVYAVPRIFATYKVDHQLVVNLLLSTDIDLSQDMDPYAICSVILDEIIGMKACKASIKAWQKLSPLEMTQLIHDWSERIEWLFVCQHGRPSVVKITKSHVDGLFGR